MSSKAPKTLQNQLRFKTTLDFHNWLNENNQANGADLQRLRSECYKRIEKLRGRPLLVYASAFIQGRPGTSIELFDIEGFTDLVNSVSGSEVDIILHSPGGSPDATERIVNILRNKFDKITFIIPHSAYSAATMLALSGNEIILHPSASLGPIDPQINGTPARQIRDGFKKALDRIKEDGPESLPAYIPLIEKYTLDLLELCEDAEKLSKELISTWLTDYLMKDHKPDDIEKVVEYFSDFKMHLTHSRPITFKKLSEFNIKDISNSEGELSELIWEAYILLTGLFGGTGFVKIFENSGNLSWGKQMMLIAQPGNQMNSVSE
jgi:Serine dehydrogenase proteinase